MRGPCDEADVNHAAILLDGLLGSSGVDAAKPIESASRIIGTHKEKGMP